MKPGFQNWTVEQYEADPCPRPSLRATHAKMLLSQSPRHVHFSHPRLNPASEPSVSSELMYDGLVRHDLFCGGSSVVELDFDSYRTNAAKETRDELLKNGKLPMLSHKLKPMRALVDAVKWQLRQYPNISDMFRREVSLAWQEDGIWLRQRDDQLPDEGPEFYDYKFTDNANPDTWSRIAYSTGADIQAAFHERGLRAIGWHERPEIRFIVIERNPPHCISIVGLDPVARQIAQEKVDRAINIWRQCLESNKWPAYPRQTAYVAPPGWIMQQWEDQKINNESLGDTA